MKEIKAANRYITDECRRNKGDEAAVEEAVQAVRKELQELCRWWSVGEEATLHATVVVKYHES